MAACPNCLYGVGRLDEKCGQCGTELSPEKTKAAVRERAKLVPRPPYQVGESVIPAVLCIGGIAAIISGGVFGIAVAGQEVTIEQMMKLTVLLANGAVMVIFGFWSIMRQRARFVLALNPIVLDEPAK